jgi:DNA-binding response OmpR family regulator
MENKFKAAERDRVDILVVEDEAHIRRFLQFVLERAGYLVEVLNGGETVSEFVEHNRPRALLLDLVLPGISGEQVIAELERSHLRDGLKIIVLTARSLDHDQGESLADSVEACATKPIAPSKLLTTLTETGIHPQKDGS